jgi:hypothetical protein
MDFDNFLKSELGLDAIKKKTNESNVKSVDTSIAPKNVQQQLNTEETVKIVKKPANKIADEFFSALNNTSDTKNTEEEKDKKLELEKKRRAEEIEKMNNIIKDKETKREKAIEEAKKREAIENEESKKTKVVNKEEKKEKIEETVKQKEVEKAVEPIKVEEIKKEEIKKQTPKDEYSIDKNFVDIKTIKEVIITGTTKLIEEINVQESIIIEEIEKPDEEYLTIFYILNDNTNNPEFLDEEVLAISKKEAELREQKQQKEEEFNFKLEELVDNNRVTVNLSDL